MWTIIDDVEYSGIDRQSMTHVVVLDEELNIEVKTNYDFVLTITDSDLSYHSIDGHNTMLEWVTVDQRWLDSLELSGELVTISLSLY